MKPVGSEEGMASVRGQAKTASREEHGIVRRSTVTSDVDKSTEVS